MQTEVLRAFRFTLDPTPAQQEDLLRHAGAARWAFNHALGMKIAAHQQWRTKVQGLVDSGVAESIARKQVRVPVPMKPEIQKHLNRIKGDSQKQPWPAGSIGPARPCPWWREVSTYAFQSAFIDADQAWKNWLDSLAGRRAGRKVGYPRFKKKSRAKDSFRLHHTVTQPTIRLDGYRRLTLPRLGTIRVHDSGKRLARLITRGHAVVQSVTVSRSANRWYAAVLVKVRQDLPDRPTRRQQSNGTVGVDLGVKTLAALTQPVTLPGATDTLLVPNPRHLAADTRRLTQAQRALSRTTKGSARRRKAARRVAQLHHRIAERRSTYLHTLTKQLTTRYATVAVEDLNVSGMSASARGTVQEPGRKVRQKAGLNRAILDMAPAEIRRQLGYKTRWNGSRLAVCDRYYPSSKTCSACGWQNPRLTLADRTFTCGQCGLTIDRDLNAARNIAAHAVPTPLHSTVAPGTEETQNARRAATRPTTPRGGRQAAKKREDTGRQPPVPPQRSDPLTLQPPQHQEMAKGP
ncbi:IS607 family element RNA-guided endonuclease TnpB [Streptomyces anulatus]|uniref:IS607 family element RNA-guided endonuclease TnpB n=1 Tax=Streptomyces anulatus TaxID=1892 RepID=UPI0022563634|nr:IS607 family element RNA-guided endonuclease TnpB [Streptomyces anulatus]MCX4524028.1 IS607 family element RNA-guided endonuclease TnpB [Streptomyces anulatus]